MISHANELRHSHADIVPIKISIFKYISDNLLLLIANTCGIIGGTDLRAPSNFLYYVKTFETVGDHDQ